MVSARCARCGGVGVGLVRKASGGRPAHLILHFITSRHASQPTPATPLEATRTRGDPHRPPDLCIPSPCAESTAATTTFALLVASPPLRCGRAEPTAAAAQPAPQSQARGFWKLPSHLVGWSPTTQIARPRLLRRQPGRCRLCPRYDRRIRALGLFLVSPTGHTHTPTPASAPPSLQDLGRLLRPGMPPHRRSHTVRTLHIMLPPVPSLFAYQFNSHHDFHLSLCCCCCCCKSFFFFCVCAYQFSRRSLLDANASSCSIAEMERTHLTCAIRRFISSPLAVPRQAERERERES